MVKDQATVRGRALVGGAATIRNQAIVEQDATVDGNADVCGYSAIYNFAHIGGDAFVHNGEVFDTAKVMGTAAVIGGLVRDTAQILDAAIIRERAHVSGPAIIGGTDTEIVADMFVDGGTWTTAPLYFKAKYSVINCAPGEVRIGCTKMTIARWLSHGKAMAKLHKLSDTEIKLYRKIVKFIQEFGC